jgi:hypothetical protein
MFDDDVLDVGGHGSSEEWWTESKGAKLLIGQRARENHHHHKHPWNSTDSGIKAVDIDTFVPSIDV